MQSAQNKSPTPSCDKTDQKSSSTASKDYLVEQSHANEIESSYSQHKLPMVPLNSCDNGSHGSFAIDDGATPLLPLTENGFNFNITYIPTSSTVPLSDNNQLTDTKDQGNIM